MVEKSTLPKFYFNLKTELKNQLKNTTAWTAGVSLIVGLKTVISMMEKEGIDNVFAAMQLMQKLLEQQLKH